MKICNKCHIEKSFDNFCKHRCMKDGYNTVCKECVKRLQKNPPFNLMYSKKSKEKFKKEKPIQYSAMQKIWNDVKRGNIIKPNKCFMCEKNFDKKRIHAHHEDYNKPLIVTWLCETCHAKIHAIKNKVKHST